MLNCYTQYLSKQQTGWYTIAAWFLFEPMKNGRFSGIFFQDFPTPQALNSSTYGSGIFKEKIQDFAGGMGTLLVEYWPVFWCAADADGVRKRLSHFSHDVMLHRHLSAQTQW